MAETGRTEDELQAIRQGELLRRQIDMVQQVNGKYQRLVDDMSREFAALGAEIFAAGLPLDESAREIRRLNGGLDGLADWAFRRGYLEARAKETGQ